MATHDDIQSWPSAPQTPTLSTNEAHVWLFPLDAPSDAVDFYRTLLSHDELKRAERFHFPKDRRRFTVSHGVLKQILHRYVSQKPNEIAFRLNDYGKPFLPHDEVQFNLSHSHEMGLIGVALEREIGVDIELVREDFEHEGIAKRFFSQGEILQLQSIAAERRRTAFYHCWVRKEAYIKAKGKGLSIPLEGFTVSVSPNDDPIDLTVHAESGERSQWSLQALPVPDPYAAAVAIEGEAAALRLWKFTA